MILTQHNDLPGGPGVTLNTGLFTLTIFCVGPEDMPVAGFCTKVTVWVLPVFVVTMEIVGFMGVALIFILVLEEPRVRRPDVPIPLAEMPEIFCGGRKRGKGKNEFSSKIISYMYLYKSPWHTAFCFIHNLSPKYNHIQTFLEGLMR